jgi:hypothetical protein
MTMLTHTGGSFESSSRPTLNRGTAATVAIGDHLTRIGHVCRFMLGVLFAGGALAGVIALKTVAFTWNLHF